MLALIENFLIIVEMPSGPKPSIIFKSKNFHKNNPIFLDDLTNEFLTEGNYSSDSLANLETFSMEKVSKLAKLSEE